MCATNHPKSKILFLTLINSISVIYLEVRTFTLSHNILCNEIPVHHEPSVWPIYLFSYSTRARTYGEESACTDKMALH